MMKGGSRIRTISVLGWVSVFVAVIALTVYVFLQQGGIPDTTKEMGRHEQLVAMSAQIETVQRSSEALSFPLDDETAFLSASDAWRNMVEGELSVLEQRIAEYASFERNGISVYEGFGSEAFHLVTKAKQYVDDVKSADEEGDLRAAQAARYSALETIGSVGTLIDGETIRSRNDFSGIIDEVVQRLIRAQTVSMYLIFVIAGLAALYVRMSSRRLREGMRMLTTAVNRVAVTGDESEGISERYGGQVIGRLARSIDDLVKSFSIRLREARIETEKLRDAVKAAPIAVTGESDSARLAEMRDTQAAMLNLLEDLEKERNVSRDEAARIRTVITSIVDGVIMVGTDGLIRVINPTAVRMLGLGDVDAAGKRYGDILPPFENMKGEPLGEDEHPVQKSLHTGQIASGQLTIVRKDGTLPVSYRTAPVISGSQLVGIVVVFRDIVDEVELDRAKSEFVSIASHQLKTPLNGIRWYIESILDGDFGELTEELRGAIGDVHESSLHMAELIDTLLNVSRIESGRVRIDPQPVALKGVVEEVLNEVRPAVEGKKVVVSTEFDPQVPEIKLDRNLIKVVVQNFITNAIKYSKDGGPVSVTLSKEDGNAKLAVKDTGYGIPLEQQKNIFKKMFRAENVQEKKIEGNGLGLYIAKSVIDTFGGRIWFESVENEGTTFYFTVPLSGVARREGDRTLIAV